jgi:hypothetical protein
MNIALKSIVIVIVFLFLLSAFVDQAFLHSKGLVSIEKVLGAKKSMITPTLSPKKEYDKENEQGYNWAEEQDISDVKNCVSKSDAFVEGCKQYIQDNADDSKQDQDDEGL